jgi:hypothetical protein
MTKGRDPCDERWLGARHEVMPAAREAAAAARGADRERDLITGAPVVSGSGEDLASHREQGSVIIEAIAGGAPQLVHGLAERRGGLRRSVLACWFQ